MTEASVPGAAEHTEPGLITQRKTAERGRATAILWIVAGAGWALVGVGNSLRSAYDGWFYVQLVLAVVLSIYFIASGIVKLRARNLRVAQFEARFGKDAGRQRSSQARGN